MMIALIALAGKSNAREPFRNASEAPAHLTLDFFSIASGQQIDS
jgi:hypothetical protein